jgi:hypothetical protein
VLGAGIIDHDNANANDDDGDDGDDGDDDGVRDGYANCVS